MDDVATRRLNEQIRREQRTVTAWKEKYGKRADYLFPNDSQKAARLRELHRQMDKLGRADFEDMAQRKHALETLRASMQALVNDVDTDKGSVQ